MLNIHGVFNFENFTNFQTSVILTHDTLFLCSDCKSINGTHLGAKLPNLQGNLSKKILLNGVPLILGSVSVLVPILALWWGIRYPLPEFCSTDHGITWVCMNEHMFTFWWLTMARRITSGIWEYLLWRLPMKARLAARFAKKAFRGVDEVQSHTTLATSANTWWQNIPNSTWLSRKWRKNNR